MNIVSKLKGRPTPTAETTYAVLVAIGLCHLLNDTVQAVIPAMYPIMKADYAFTFAQIGLINFVYQCTSSVLQPVVGVVDDRRPQPYSLPIGMALTFAGMLAMAWADRFALILVAVSVIGAGSAIFHPEASRVAQLASGGRKSLAQSIFQVGGNIGNSVGPLLTAAIIIPYGQKASCWFALIALLTGLILVRVGAWYAQMLRSGLTAVAGRAKGIATSVSRRQVRWSMGILVTLIFSKYIYNACMTSYFTFFLIERFGLSVQQSQMCLFIYLAAFAAGTLFGGFLGDRYGRKWVITFSILGSLPFALALPYMNLFWTMTMAVCVGLIISSAFSAIFVFATDLCPSRVGLIAGVFSGLMFGLGGIGSAFFGWLADETSIEYIFRLSSWMPLLGVVALFLPNIKYQKPNS